jgi:hypothetical protein
VIVCPSRLGRFLAGLARLGSRHFVVRTGSIIAGSSVRTRCSLKFASEAVTG